MTQTLNSGLAIVFTCWGNPWYLRYALAQAALSCPRLQVILLGDATNRGYPGVSHFMIADYDREAQGFATAYRHLSSNPRWFELSCFQRWFVLRTFLERQGVKKCLSLDGDVMLYCDAAAESQKFGAYDFTVSAGSGPQATYWGNVGVLDAWCDLAMRSYTVPTMLDELRATFDRFTAQKKPGGVCDMTFFRLLGESGRFKTFDTATPVGDSLYDHNINESNGFEMEAGRKRIWWIDGRPWGRKAEQGTMLRFNSLHFQGAAKPYMRRAYLGPGGRGSAVGLVCDAALIGVQRARRLAIRAAGATLGRVV